MFTGRPTSCWALCRNAPSVVLGPQHGVRPRCVPGADTEGHAATPSATTTPVPLDRCMPCLCCSLYASKVDISQYPDLVFTLDKDVRLVVPPTRYFYTVCPCLCTRPPSAFQAGRPRAGP